MDYKFYDTSSLLLKADNLFSNQDTEKVIISSITIQELENIKTSNNKDQDIKYAARHLLKKLENFNYELILFNSNMLNLINGTDFEITNDIKILVSALYYKKQHSEQELFFITNDIVLKKIAELFFDKHYICSIDEDKVDDYGGYLDISLSPEEMIDLYQYPEKNKFNLLINQYIIIRNKENNEVVDALCWTGQTHRRLKYHELNSRLFGKIKPMKNDIYQALVVDSLLNNQITMLKGKAGSGKSTLSIAYLFDQLERGKIDKIIIFCNPVATKNSARLGFYPGTRDEKLLDSQIGNFLISKLGDRLVVEELINRGELVLLPLSDIRGYDTSGMKTGVYITEAQNLDKTLIKLALQRIGEDSICIIDGDCRAQVDDISFSGVNNGMKKASKIFRGNDIYGEVELQKIHRSRIAEIAENI